MDSKLFQQLSFLTETETKNCKQSARNEISAEASNENSEINQYVSEKKRSVISFNETVNIEYLERLDSIEQANPSNEQSKSLNYRMYYIIDEDEEVEDRTKICFKIKKRLCVERTKREYIGYLSCDNFRGLVRRSIKTTPFKSNILELGSWEQSPNGYYYFYTSIFNASLMLIERRIKCYSPENDIYGVGVFFTSYDPDTPKQKKIKKYFNNFGYTKYMYNECAFAFLKKEMYLEPISNDKNNHVFAHKGYIDLEKYNFRFILKEPKYRYLLDILK